MWKAKSERSPLSDFLLSEMILVVVGILSRGLMSLSVRWWVSCWLCCVTAQCPSYIPFNAGQRWWTKRRWRERELSNRRQGGRQEACNRSCVCMFFLKKVRWMLRCLQAAPCYQVNPAPLALHHQHWSLHIAGQQCWWLTGWLVDANKHTHTHTHAHTQSHMEVGAK